ncbi:MAG: hypothetical protein ACXW11_11505 [Methylotenera sp.]
MAKFQTREEIQNWLDSMGVEKYKINEDLTVDVDGDVFLIEKELIEIPVQFGKVSEFFLCVKNKLSSLEGCPKEVVGDFDCSDNELTSLEGSPKIVGGTFQCSNNKLVDLKGCPEFVGDSFDCSGNQLTSLQDISKEVGGMIRCKNNKQLDESFHLMRFEKIKQYYSDLKLDSELSVQNFAIDNWL